MHVQAGSCGLGGGELLVDIALVGDELGEQHEELLVELVGV